MRVAYRTPPEEEDACLSASISATTLAGVTLFVSAKVTRLEGNLEIKIKAPPSNRVWYGFTSMPEMDVKIEPEIGSLKIPEWVNTHFVTAIKKAVSAVALCHITYPCLYRHSGNKSAFKLQARQDGYVSTSSSS